LARGQARHRAFNGSRSYAPIPRFAPINQKSRERSRVVHGFWSPWLWR